MLVAAVPASPGELPRVEPPCSYDVQVIEGPLMPNGFTAGLIPLCINNLGEVGGRASPGLAKVPFTWTAEGGFAWVPMPSGIGEGWVVEMNDNGWLLIQSHVSPGGDRGYIVPAEGRATAEWISILPTGTSGYSYTRGINNLNEVVGHRTSPNAEPGALLPYAGFKWSPEAGALTDIYIDAAGNPSSGLLRINDQGVLLGWSSLGGFSTFNTVSHILQDRKVVTFDSEVKGGGMLPTDLAADGSGVVVERVVEQGPSGSDTKQYSFIVREGNIVCELPVLSPYPSAVAVGVNSSGVAVGDSRSGSAPGPVTPLGTVWFDGVPYSANELAGFLSGSSFHVTSVAAINEKGQMVGYIPSGGRLAVLTPNGVPGDLDCDGVVGPADLAILLGAWGREGTRADLDGSGIVDGEDLGVLLAAWGS